MPGRPVRPLIAQLCRALIALTLLAPPLTACGARGGGEDADSAPGGSSATLAGKGLPAVEGAYGEKPTLSVPKGEPVTELQSAVLSEGEGPAVASGDLLVVDYLGQIWAEGKPEVFDNSYDRGVPTAFPIGIGQVIKAWDEVIVGVKAGSRVLMTVPPDKGYGEKGNPPTIEGTDTLIFVVDVIASFNKTSTARGTPTGQTGAGGVSVTGDVGAEPTVSIPVGTPAPSEPSVTVLSRGSGEPVTGPAAVIANVVVSSWDGQQRQSSWQQGPQSLTVGDPNKPSPLDSLVGVPVGSRVLVVFPPPAGQDPASGSEDPATASVAAVIDVLGAPGPAKDSA